MSILTGMFVSYLIIHGIVTIRTGYSSFYWLSRILFHLEAIQNGMFRSLPHWFEWWRYMMNEERKVMHENARDRELLSRVDGVETSI